VGGIPEIAREPANCLVPPGDGEALADAIRQELHNPTSTDSTAACLPTWADSAKELVGILEKTKWHAH